MTGQGTGSVAKFLKGRGPEKMKKIGAILAVLLLGAIFTTASAQQRESYDVFIPIGKYLSQGDAESLSAWFADNLEITVFTKTSTSSRTQAIQILKSFFASHTPRSFDITHAASRGTTKYALGTLNAGGEKLLVTIFVSQKDNSYQIQQLKIARTDSGL